MQRPKWYVRDPPPVEDLLEAIVGPSGRSLPAAFGSLQTLVGATAGVLFILATQGFLDRHGQRVEHGCSQILRIAGIDLLQHKLHCKFAILF